MRHHFNINLLIFPLSLFGFLSALAAPVLAAGIASIPTKSDRSDLILDIEASADLQNEVKGPDEINFKDVCKSFGSYFVNNQGLWGTGGFHGYNCLEKNARARSKRSPWRLKISRDQDNSRFEIVFHDATTERAFTQAVYNIEAQIGTLRLLNEDRYSRLIAAYLNLRLPFCFQIDDEKLEVGRDIKFLGSSLEEIQPPTLDLRIFSISRNKQLWKTRLLAMGKLNLDGGNVVLAVKEIKSDGNIKSENGLGHFTKNRKEFAESVDELLQSRIKKDFLSLITSTRLGYSGLRFAFPVGGGSGAFAEATSFGLLGELRGGALPRLKIYFDVTPKITIEDNLGSESLSMSRLQVGYSYGFPVAAPIINWFDVTPKLGLNTIDYQVLKRADFSLPSKYSFKISNSPAIGVELAVERRNEQITGRAWIFANYSLGISQLEKNNKSSIFKYGMDLFRDVLEFDTVKLAALAFFCREITTIEKGAADNIGPSTLRYTSLLAGAGTVISW